MTQTVSTETTFKVVTGRDRVVLETDDWVVAGEAALEKNWPREGAVSARCTYAVPTRRMTGTGPMARLPVVAAATAGAGTTAATAPTLRPATTEAGTA
jgi:hypothetical protein